MGLLGISLIVGAVVWLCFRPPAWIWDHWRNLQQPRLDPPSRKGLLEGGDGKDTGGAVEGSSRGAPADRKEEEKPEANGTASMESDKTKAWRDRLAMPPPPPPPPVIQPPPIVMNVGGEDQEQTTPKALASDRDDAVPSFSLSDTDYYPTAVAPGTSTLPLPTASRTSPGLMAPPPRPSPRPPTLNSLAPPRSSVPNRNLPIPNRGGPSTSLAPPPTHSAKPQKPSRQVVLTPGHSPLDWARLSSNPTADLRGVPSDSPYIKVTPSMLKKMTGRKGKDAWMALGGRVYNITPYIPFHPGGEPELLRGAARDGTKLFGEIHPWVNYEGMLSACLIGILVSEEDVAGPAAGKMEEMD